MNRKLRDARIRKGWSQQEAADAANVTLRTYQRWEHEQYLPNFASRRFLRDAFGCSDEELGFDLAVSEKQDHDNEQQTVTRGGEQLLRLTAEQVAVLKLVLGERGMAVFDEAKRRTLRQIAAALGMVASGTQSVINPEAWERLVITSAKPAAFNDAALDRFENLLGEGWGLSNVNELGAAEGVVSSFLPKILAIPRREVTPQIAFLASQGLRLQSVLIHHRLQIDEKILMCQKSVEYALHANDPNTLVPALIELADAYEFDGQIEKCLQTLQDALHCSSQASPLVQSRACSNNAIILAQVGRKKEAELYIQLAHDTFPDNPLLDPACRLADSSVFTLSYHTGLVRLDIGQVSNAPAGFDFYKEHPSGVNIPERLRLEIVNGHSKAAIRANNLEHYAGLFENALAGATALGSKKRYEEAIHIFQQEVPNTWLDNGTMKSIVQKYRLERKR